MVFALLARLVVVVRRTNAAQAVRTCPAERDIGYIALTLAWAARVISTGFALMR